jgi:hypothetical protein
MLLVVINIFCIDFFGDFSMIHFIWFIALHDRKRMFCVFLSFKVQYEVKLYKDFFWSIFYRRRRPWLLEEQRVTMKAKMAHVVRSTCGTAPPGPTWASSVRGRPSSSQDLCFDLKMHIKRPPRRSRTRRRWEQRNHEQSQNQQKIGGETLVESISACISNFSNVIISISKMRRE